jgi:nucleoid-associated protein YgaU
MYRVVAGDNLYAIAAKHLGKASRWRELAALNRASLGNKNLVYPNQWLILPTKVT